MTTSGSGIPAEIGEYLAAATQCFQTVLGDRLLGLYLCGSAVQGDFAAARSDIDLLGVVDGELDETTCGQLASGLSESALAVPAQGLEVVLFPAEAAQAPALDFPFAFALSTGPGTDSACEPPGIANDMLIDVALCRDAGVTLVGKAPAEAFGPVPLPMLRAALIEELRWHIREVQRRCDDKTLVNAILNAARSLHAAETGRILSKSEGGHWWLRRHPQDALVAQALEFRRSGTLPSFDPDAGPRFVETIVETIERMREDPT